MSLRFFQKLTAAAMIPALLLGWASLAKAADAPLTKDDVRKIVQEYIMAHPEDILKSVQEFQDRTTRERQDAALKENGKDLFDPDTPMAGNAKGDVTIVEFFDYNCGYCKKALPEINKLIEEDKNVRVLFKDFPILGPSSETAAKWAIAAHKQDKYFEFHKAMMNNHAPLNDETLSSVAKKVGMDVEKAKAYVEGADVLVQIEKNRNLGGSMGIRGTPAFVVGSKIIPGAADYDALKKMVDDVRAEKKAATTGSEPVKEEEKKDDKK